MKTAWRYALPEFKGDVNPVALSEPEFFILFTILNMNVYIFFTNINHLIKDTWLAGAYPGGALGAVGPGVTKGAPKIF